MILRYSFLYPKKSRENRAVVLHFHSFDSSLNVITRDFLTSPKTSYIECISKYPII